MVAPNNDWQSRIDRSLARHVNLLLSTHFGGSPAARPDIAAPADAGRSPAGLVLRPTDYMPPALGGAGNTLRDALVRAGSVFPRSNAGGRIGPSTEPVPPAFRGADPFDFPPATSPQDPLAVPDIAYRLDSDGTPPAMTDVARSSPDLPDVFADSPVVPEWSSPKVVARRRSAHNGDSQRPEPAADVEPSHASDEPMPTTITVSLGNENAMFKELLQTVAKQLRDLIVGQSGREVRRGLWAYSESLRTSMGD